MAALASNDATGLTRSGSAILPTSMLQFIPAGPYAMLFTPAIEPTIA
jgi:hypothetical protein